MIYDKYWDEYIKKLREQNFIEYLKRNYKMPCDVEEIIVDPSLYKSIIGENLEEK